MDNSINFHNLLQSLHLCTQHSQLIETAQNEALRLPPLRHPSTYQQYLTSLNDVDWISHSIYPEDAPTNLWPRSVIGDGNCLFRSASVIVYGNESHHAEMR